MSVSPESRPPRWADRLLKWYCRPELLEDLQGDLYEFYYRRVEAKGVRNAQWNYGLDVLKFFRLYTVKQLKIPTSMNFLYLWKSYLKTSSRSIARNKLFSSINIVGLSISMTVGVLMIIMVSELLSFDRFHDQYDNIYRVTNHTWDHQEGELDFASTSAVAGYELMNGHSAIDQVVLIRRHFGGVATYGEKSIAISGHWASKEFFNLFSFELLHGNPATALAEPNSIVLTEKTAKKLFGEEDPMGKTIELGNREMSSGIVTGIVANPPLNSHIQFQALGSFDTYANYVRNKSGEEKSTVDRWNSMWMYHVYFRVQDPTRLADIQTFLDQVSDKYNEDDEYFKIYLGTQAMAGIMPGPQYSNNIGPSMDENIIWILTALTSIVLLSACFNYTNLSIARSLRRSKEVGIRKVVGASRVQVFTQFVLEAILLSGIAAIIAMGLFFIIRPEFLVMVTEEMHLLTLDFKLWYLLPVIGFAILIGLISGFLPSLFLSKLQALIAIKHPDKIKMFSGVTLRMVLIVFQFTLSIAFIITTVISYKQYKYVLAYDLGFSTENILNVNVQGNDPEVLKTRFSEIAGVVETSRSGMVMSVGEIWGETLKYKDPLDSISVHINPIDRDYLALHDIQLLAGENFRTQAEDSELVQIIVNERVLKRFNMGAPEEVIGEIMEYTGETAEIVGVMPDIQYLKLNSEAEPFLFLYPSTNFNTVNLKLQTADLISVMDQLEEAWQEVDPVHVFNASFYDDRIRSAYSGYEALMKIVGFVSALVISIASLGLLGMAVYSTESRIKEISIRKVLGATEQSLVYLISRGYILVIIIAAFIAIPLTYLFFEEVLFSDVAYRVAISALDLGLGLMIIVLIAFSMVGWQTMKAARANPADTLRDE